MEMLTAAMVAVEEHAELLKGKQGPKGETGPAGRAGALGEMGPVGRPGKSITGPVGMAGRNGRDGERGPIGPKGETGPAGKVGSPGKDGVGPDERVRVSKDDPKAGFLADKLTAGNGIEIRTATGKRGERLVIDATAQGGVSGGSAGIIAYDDGVAVGAGNKVSFDGGDPVTISGGIIRVPVGSTGGSGIPQGGPLTEDLDADGWRLVFGGAAPGAEWDAIAGTGDGAATGATVVLKAADASGDGTGGTATLQGGTSPGGVLGGYVIARGGNDADGTGIVLIETSGGNGGAAEFHGNSATEGGRIELLAGPGGVGLPGGEVALRGGFGDDGDDDGASITVGGGDGVGNPGRIEITTNGVTGDAGDLLTAQGDGMALWAAPTGLPGSPETYTESNVVTDRAYDATASTLDEVLAVLGTLIGDLRTRGVLA